MVGAYSLSDAALAAQPTQDDTTLDEGSPGRCGPSKPPSGASREALRWCLEPVNVRTSPACVVRHRFWVTLCNNMLRSVTGELRTKSV